MFSDICTRLLERLAAAIIRLEFSFGSGLVSSDLAVPVRPELMQTEDDNQQDNTNDCVERWLVLIICSPIHRTMHLCLLSDLSPADV